MLVHIHVHVGMYNVHSVQALMDGMLMDWCCILGMPKRCLFASCTPFVPIYPPTYWPTYVRSSRLWQVSLHFLDRTDTIAEAIPLPSSPFPQLFTQHSTAWHSYILCIHLPLRTLSSEFGNATNALYCSPLTDCFQLQIDLNLSLMPHHIPSLSHHCLCIPIDIVQRDGGYLRLDKACVCV